MSSVFCRYVLLVTTGLGLLEFLVMIELPLDLTILHPEIMRIKPNYVCSKSEDDTSPPTDQSSHQISNDSFNRKVAKLQKNPKTAKGNQVKKIVATQVRDDAESPQTGKMEDMPFGDDHV